MEFRAASGKSGPTIPFLLSGFRHKFPDPESLSSFPRFAWDWPHFARPSGYAITHPATEQGDRGTCVRTWQTRAQSDRRWHRLPCPGPGSQTISFPSERAPSQASCDAMRNVRLSYPPRQGGFHLFCHTYGSWMVRYGKLDNFGLTRTGRWKDPRSAEVYVHTEINSEARLAAVLPTPPTRENSGNEMRGYRPSPKSTRIPQPA